LQDVVLGSLVSWNGEWYWSGLQYVIGKVSATVTHELRSEFLKSFPHVVYRYCSDLAQKARDNMKAQYDEFIRYHGDNLVVYPDGLSMAADQQAQYKLHYKSFPEETILEVQRKHNLEKPIPTMSYPQALLDDETGIGLFFNENEGQEIMQAFNHIINGMKKRGINLTEIESEIIRGFIFSEAISPKFIEKMVEKYGDESIASAFLIREPKESHYLDYLLRRHKGHFYKNRYPNISFVD